MHYMKVYSGIFILKKSKINEITYILIVNNLINLCYW